MTSAALKIAGGETVGVYITFSLSLFGRGYPPPLSESQTIKLNVFFTGLHAIPRSLGLAESIDTVLTQC